MKSWRKSATFRALFIGAFPLLFASYPPTFLVHVLSVSGRASAMTVIQPYSCPHFGLITPTDACSSVSCRLLLRTCVVGCAYQGHRSVKGSQNAMRAVFFRSRWRKECSTPTSLEKGCVQGAHFSDVTWVFRRVFGWSAVFWLWRATGLALRELFSNRGGAMISFRDIFCHEKQVRLLGLPFLIPA